MSNEYVQLFISLCILLICFVVHEYAHGWMANKLGDPTAKLKGRLTLNPIKHMDLFGSVILPAFLFALTFFGSPFLPVLLAKPVPVDFRRLRNPRRGIIYVGMAGPAINIIIAVLLSLIYDPEMVPFLEFVVKMFIAYNLLLAIFNMVPIPPLDGSRLVMGLLPSKWARKYSQLEPFGIIIVFALLPFGLFGKIIVPLVIGSAKLLGVELL